MRLGQNYLLVLDCVNQLDKKSLMTHMFWEAETGVALSTILITSFEYMLGLVVYVF